MTLDQVREYTQEMLVADAGCFPNLADAQRWCDFLNTICQYSVIDLQAFSVHKIEDKEHWSYGDYYVANLMAQEKEAFADK